MDQAEASGKTVEDALNRALAQLGASRDEVEFVVLDEGRKGGLFGRGAKEAVVRVERVAQAGRPQGDRAAPDTRIPRGPQGTQAGQRGGRAPGGQRGDRGPAGGQRDGRTGGFGGRGERGPRSGGGRTGFEQPVPKLTEQDFHRAPRFDEETPPGAEAAPPAPADRAPRGRRAPDGAPPARGRDEGGERPPERERRRRDEEPHVDPDINAEEVDFAAHIVDDMLRLLDIDAGLTIREPQTPGDGLGVVRAVIDISGEDLGLLIGRRGDTLLSLQYLVNLIVGRRYPGKGGVSIDVEHYRHRREEQVVSLAQRMADRVRQTGAAITLEPMSPAERRLVHITLAEDPELETNSVGEGENRKVVISSRR
jgi:spoIIIJ-associated protein